MADFDAAFRKVFVGTKASQSASGSQKGVQNGFLTSTGVKTASLIDTAAPYGLGPGVFGMFDPTTFLSVDSGSAAVTGGKKLILAASSIKRADKVGSHGGYQESTKSKDINPKYINKFYRVDSCDPQNHILHIGNTNYTSQLSPANAACCFEFLCGETYSMYLQVKGSPAMRFLNKPIYRQADFYTGCCGADGAPEPVDSTLVMIGWADYIITDPILKDFISPIVFDEAGNAWYAPGTSGASQTWDNYVSTGHTADACAGLRLEGAYVDTTFNNCSFQVSDHYEVQPVQLFASMVDLNGDPCTFEGICVLDECLPRQGMGSGEEMIRDLILSERYLQNDFSPDMRIREVTLGDDNFDVITRGSRYTSYFILHSVPRFNNPTSQFDNEQYLLRIVTPGQSAAFETLMSTWLAACGCEQVTLETFDCTTCTPVAIP